ncbi:MAG: acyloxyacyl hydrolase [Veillonellaceae bacterium]|mgnify:CR=1 FL=1|jgi:lipid A 3-O-deacylase|nr:acyloxyacyl hydrolase [Veillonellaceae bacterium]
MRRLVCLIIVINFFLVFMPEKSYAADSNVELDWDYLTSYNDAANLDTVSLHILEKISEKKNKSIYRGITITRPHGDITVNNQTRNSSAVGIGPTYMIRYEKPQSEKLSMALDVSGGLIIYDKVFPAGGRYYNFMWRIGPQFIYKINDNSSVNLGYMVVHVSNGFKTHNPGYDSRGISLGFTTKF